MFATICSMKKGIVSAFFSRGSPKCTVIGKTAAINLCCWETSPTKTSTVKVQRGLRRFRAVNIIESTYLLMFLRSRISIYNDAAYNNVTLYFKILD